MFWGLKMDILLSWWIQSWQWSALTLNGGCSSCTPAPTAGSSSPWWALPALWPRADRRQGSAQAMVMAWIISPFPGSGTRGWALMGSWKRIQGYPFLWQSSFMMDQINSGTISSVFCWCPNFWKASVFCPKSQVFVSVDVLRDGSNRFIVGTCCSFLAVTKSMFMDVIRHCICILVA